MDYKKELNDLKEYMKVYIASLSLNLNKKIYKIIDYKSLCDYLSKRGFVRNNSSTNDLYTKGFICVQFNSNVYNQVDSISIFIDKIKSKSNITLNESLLTNLPITLKYLERHYG